MCKYPESDLIYSRALKNFNFFSEFHCTLPINFEAEENLSFPTFRCSSAAKSIHFLICLEYFQLYPNIMFNIWFPLHVLIVTLRICLEQECFRYPEFEIKWGRLCVLKLEPRGIYFVESWILSCSYCYRSLVLVFPVCVCLGSVPRHLFISFVAEFNYHYLYQMHNHTKSLSSSLSLLPTVLASQIVFWFTGNRGLVLRMVQVVLSQQRVLLQSAAHRRGMLIRWGPNFT